MTFIDVCFLLLGKGGRRGKMHWKNEKKKKKETELATDKASCDKVVGSDQNVVQGKTYR